MISGEGKNSKANWLREIPQHWDVVRLKTQVRGGTNGVWGSEQKNNKNDIVCVRVADIDEWQYGISESDLTYRNILESDQYGRLLNFGDLIIEKSGGGEISPVGRVIIYNLDKKAVTSNFMARLNLIGDINKEYLYYYFRFLYHRRLNLPAIKATTGIQNLDLYAYLQNRIPIPTQKEQETIVSYINQKSGEINRFIQTKQRFIELLKEQRQSIITNAVTKGIDNGVKMKETGIDWIGNVPKHWEIKRFKNICLLQRGHDLPKEHFKEGEYPVYGSNGIIGYHKEYTTKSPCITIGRSGSVGEINFIEKNFWAHNTCLFVKENYNNDWEYLYFLISSIDIKMVSNGSAVPTLDRNNVHSLRISYPPNIEEQRQIVGHIKSETRTLDIAINKAEREIELIKEYREAIIAEAVTGKLKLT